MIERNYAESRKQLHVKVASIAPSNKPFKGYVDTIFYRKGNVDSANQEWCGIMVKDDFGKRKLKGIGPVPVDLKKGDYISGEIIASSESSSMTVADIHRA